jgi:hypothetical protein
MWEFGAPAVRVFTVLARIRLGECNAEIGSLREDNWLVGYGMAGVTYEWYTQPCQAGSRSVWAPV